ncbi:hypothetical protein BDZ97DRAFT_1916010 [Flammula alnicola]|nr:hypothetical protein BDZ97DRAFT_1916010 [Flammula alnicola]
MKTLVEKSSGHFIYASVVVKYVKSPRHRPADRLEVILGLRPALTDMPFAELDILYRHILSSVDDIELVLLILSFLILRGDWWSTNDSQGIEEFLNLNAGDVLLHLDGLSALDFLLDPLRSQEFFINPPLKHTIFARQCFYHLKSIYRGQSITGTSLIYSQYNPGYHYRRALPTPELRQDIWDFSIFSLQKNVVHHLPFLPPAIFQFILSINSMDFEDTKLLYAHQMASFEQFILTVIPKYYADLQLTALIALITVNIRTYSDIEEVERLLHINSAALDIDDVNLRLRYCIYGSDENILYTSFLRGFITNPSRAGLFTFDDHKYAIGAQQCLKYICRHHVAASPARYSTHDLGIRRRAPWRWHQKRGTNGALNGRRLRRWKVYQFRDDPPRIFVNANMIRYPPAYGAEAWERRRQHRAYSVGLDVLPDLLDRSENSPELVKFARQRAFSMLSLRYPKSTILAKQAIRHSPATHSLPIHTLYLEAISSQSYTTSPTSTSPETLPSPIAPCHLSLTVSVLDRQTHPGGSARTKHARRPLLLEGYYDLTERSCPGCDNALLTWLASSATPAAATSRGLPFPTDTLTDLQIWNVLRFDSTARRRFMAAKNFEPEDKSLAPSFQFDLFFNSVSVG